MDSDQSCKATKIVVVLHSVVVGMLLAYIIDVDPSRQETFVSAFAFWTTACIAVPAGASALYQAVRRELVANKSLYLALAAWPLLAAGVVVLSDSDRFLSGDGIMEFAFHEVGAIVAFALVPIVPLATVPLVMQYARHR